MQLNVLIIAAGLGTRMKSRRAKVLHHLLGRPLVAYGVRTALQLNPNKLIVVVGYQAEAVCQAVQAEVERASNRQPTDVEFVLQTPQLGTGHAVKVARDALAQTSGHVVIFYGDVPLIRPETIQRLVKQHHEGDYAASLLTIQMDDPTGYGRIVRDEAGRFLRIVEHRDATPEQQAIKEVNPAMYCFEIDPLLMALDQLSPINAQGEFYLPDVFRILVQQGYRVGVFPHEPAHEFQGINNRVELARVGARLRYDILERLMLSGVTIVDPASTYISAEAIIGQDTIIHPQVVIEGETRIGQDCEIYSWSRLVNAQLGDRVVVKNSCIVMDSQLGNDVAIGPFAHLRNGAVLADQVVIGNFVEVKKSRLGRQSKAMHLSYLGDATLGERVNIGAGTVTCNFDGKQKHPTIIEDEVKIGSDTMLVAPVRVGRGAVTGAGAVVTKDVPEYSLAVGVPAVVKKKLEP
ncbi:MAG: bifunctional UDP-N-acetylglucosamine diphosphorylase/glucosamine-1-phosphate N-acetyltransferase GlmU [Acidobacteriota bacterium]|nr:bifunctional UDP-N-acetylglucosamine diphosphorylase/glucosamine-1-phosphate N-acetyltransferase GlmU [Blastocatellia bacterium]MDW8238109.1 bifunctional UDP-N-acetylglucosamine diphosphorylase/glucosamine-1-phosphate N-acetyltransferase GlmU [Acidobacteriota bacterium]